MPVALITDYPYKLYIFCKLNSYRLQLVSFYIQNVNAFQERLFVKVNVSVNLSPRQRKISGTLKNESIQGKLRGAQCSKPVKSRVPSM